jgi:hypothetical protein
MLLSKPVRARMELQFNEAERRFQTEVRDFIAANLPNAGNEKLLSDVVGPGLMKAMLFGRA